MNFNFPKFNFILEHQPIDQNSKYLYINSYNNVNQPIIYNLCKSVP